MADLPPLPSGFTLDAAPAASNIPPLPAGFTLDGSSPQAASAPSTMDHVTQVMNILKQHPMTAMTGLAENALSGITGGVGSLADAVTLSEPGTHDWAYQPRTEAGQQIAQAAGDEAAAVGRGYDKIPGADTPLGQTLKRYGPEALAAVGTITGAVEAPKAFAHGTPPALTAQDVASRTAAASPQNMGAAAAAAQVSKLSPEVQQAVVRAAQKNGGAVNPTALSRHVEAQSLPVPVDLTAGQATGDEALISNERNLRGQHEDLQKRFTGQNDQLNQNVQAIRDTVGPDVFTSDIPGHGDTLIEAYRDVDKKANDQIDAAYKTARDLVPDKKASVMDAPSLLSKVTDALHEKDVFDSAPKDIMANLARRADNGQMSFANIENLKTNLARIQRSFSTDGNTRYAAGVIRDQLEQMPLTVDNPEVQTAYNKARSLARTRFQTMDADPAYKAVVNDKVAPDDFIRKFLLNGKRDDVSTMAQTLGDNDVARQTMAVAALDHLRDSAGLTPDYTGNFSQARFNKALRGLDPKIRALVDAKTADQLDTLGKVANYTQFQPKGSFVNNSNTFTAAAAKYGTKSAEGAVNYAFHGLPVGSLARSFIEGRAGKAQVRASLEPGAGLSTLAEAAKNARH
jgi:hypothetical protein